MNKFPSISTFRPTLRDRIDPSAWPHNLSTQLNILFHRHFIHTKSALLLLPHSGHCDPDRRARLSGMCTADLNIEQRLSRVAARQKNKVRIGNINNILKSEMKRPTNETINSEVNSEWRKSGGSHIKFIGLIGNITKASSST